MTPFEYQYLFASTFLPPLYAQVREQLRGLAKKQTRRLQILDVGGRKSHYTIGVSADIYISELPRVSDVQKQLNLGITENIIEQTKRRRSNIRDTVYDDMTKSVLPDNRYDSIVAIEVLEHVEEDARFVREVHRVLKPGGTFVMTTPSGEFVPNHNADHKRHYTRQQLHDLLAQHFETVNVDYAICANMFAEWGLYSWSVWRPFRTALSMFGNVVNAYLTSREVVKRSAQGTFHLVATASKAKSAAMLDAAVKTSLPEKANV